MKKIIKITALILVLFSGSTFSQEKISSKKDINKFQINKTAYIGKTVGNLLNNLNLDVKSVQLEEGNGTPNVITLRFDDIRQYKKMINNKSKIKPSKIMIFVRENDSKSNKLFSKVGNDSIANNIIKNDSITNNQLLRNYQHLTIVNIIAISEK